MDEPLLMAKEAKKHIEKGFQTLKIKVGKEAHLDLERIEGNSKCSAKKYDVTFRCKSRMDAERGGLYH